MTQAYLHAAYCVELAELLTAMLMKKAQGFSLKEWVG